MPGAIIDNAVLANTPKVIGPVTKRATRPANKLPQSLIDGSRVIKREPFDTKKHLSFQSPKKIYTMEEIGLQGQGISPIAASEPFPLFSEEAICQMRAEIFSEDAIENCQYTSSFSKNMIRGLGPARAPFIYNVWKSPEVLSKISEVAGIDLVPALDFDIGHVNISISDQTQPTAPDQGSSDDDVSVFAWHYDSFPFVCVTMLSDCTGMVGGETALRVGTTGETLKVRGPAIGTAVIMQGRYIEHQALKAFGGRERITMVTSFRPKSPLVKDETVLTGVRGISNLSELYTQYSEYRLEVLEERIRARLKTERQREMARRPFGIQEMRDFLAEQKEFIGYMLDEIYDVEND